MNLQKQKIGKDRFLQTAEKLFTERGYQAVSIRDIANEIGVTNAAIYYHFSSKEELFDEVIIQHIDRFRRRMIDAADQHEGYKEKLIAMLTVYGSIAADKHSLFTLLHMKKHVESQTDAPDRIGLMMKTFFEPIDETIQSAISAGTLRNMPADILGAPVLIGMIHGTMQQLRQFQQKEIDRDIIAYIVDIFWNGMKNRSNLSL
jgi:AcrR family transcriptional regulator